MDPTRITIDSKGQYRYHLGGPGDVVLIADSREQIEAFLESYPWKEADNARTNEATQ